MLILFFFAKKCEFLNFIYLIIKLHICVYKIEFPLGNCILNHFQRLIFVHVGIKIIYVFVCVRYKKKTISSAHICLRINNKNTPKISNGAIHLSADIIQ